MEALKKRLTMIRNDLNVLKGQTMKKLLNFLKNIFGAVNETVYKEEKKYELKSYWFFQPKNEVLAKSEVPHLELHYGRKGVIWIEESTSSSAKSEKEAFEEYFALKLKYSSIEGCINAPDEAFPEDVYVIQVIDNVSMNYYGRPDSYEGSSILVFSNGLKRKAPHSGKGRENAQFAVCANNRLKGKKFSEIWPSAA